MAAHNDMMQTGERVEQNKETAKRDVYICKCIWIQFRE